MKEILAICSFFIFAQHLPLHTGEKIMHIGEKIIYSAHYIPARIHHQKLWGNNNAIAATREKIKKLFWKIRLCVATTFLFCQACVRNYSSASLGCGCAPSCENKMPSSFFLSEWGIFDKYVESLWLSTSLPWGQLCQGKICDNIASKSCFLLYFFSPNVLPYNCTIFLSYQPWEIVFPDTG